MLSIRSAVASTLIAGFLFVGCQAEADVWVLTGSTWDRLVFGIADDREDDAPIVLREFHVFYCATIRELGHYPREAEAAWVLRSPKHGEGPRVNRVVYGQLVGVATSTVGPDALTAPGCYVVSAYLEGRYGLQHAAVGIRVLEDGSVVEMQEREYRSLFSG